MISMATTVTSQPIQGFPWDFLNNDQGPLSTTDMKSRLIDLGSKMGESGSRKTIKGHYNNNFFTKLATKKH